MSTLPKWSFTFRDRDTDVIPTRRLGDRPIYSIDVSDASFVEALARARRLVADQTHLVSGYSLYCVGASAENVAAYEMRSEYRERRVRSSALTSAPPWHRRTARRRISLGPLRRRMAQARQERQAVAQRRGSDLPRPVRARSRQAGVRTMNTRDIILHADFLHWRMQGEQPHVALRNAIETADMLAPVTIPEVIEHVLRINGWKVSG